MECLIIVFAFPAMVLAAFYFEDQEAKRKHERIMAGKEQEEE